MKPAFDLNYTMLESILIILSKFLSILIIWKIFKHYSIVIRKTKWD